MDRDTGTGTIRRVLLGVTGSIAAYKALDIVRRLQDSDCEVRVVLTQSARQIVTPAAFEAITGHPCMGEFWRELGTGEIEHIAWADWADCILVAPATADCIAKIRLGIADTPLLATILAATCPVVIAPAMNLNMLHSEPTQDHLRALARRGLEVAEPGEGYLACGWQGAGRLAEPGMIVSRVQSLTVPKDLNGHHLVVTLGPTREAVDPVRFLTNRSSGKMGVALIERALARGATVTAIHGPLSIPLPRCARTISVESALEMNEAVHRVVFEESATPSVVIMAAAVADYRPRRYAPDKLKRGTGDISIELEPNPDILQGVSHRRGNQPCPLLVGFAVETIPSGDALHAEFERKRSAKGVELLVGNRAEDAFDMDTNTVYLVEHEVPVSMISGSKPVVAAGVLDRVVSLLSNFSEP